MTPSPTGQRSKPWVTVAVYAVVLLLPLALVVGGATMLLQRGSGTAATATVDRCETTHAYKSYSQHCTGTWTVDGRPVVGAVQGADNGDVGHSIDVRIRDGEAYSTSLVLPIVLIALGLPLLGIIVWPRLRRLRASRSPT